MMLGNNLKPDRSYLLIGTVNKPASDKLSAILKEKTAEIIYITFRLPYTRLQNQFKNKKLVIIDCTCVGIVRNKKGDGYYITDGPEALTELSIVLNEKINQYNSVLVIFDSINHFLAYNSIDSLKRVLHYLTIKPSSSGTATFLFLYTEDEYKNIIVPFLTPLIDRII